MSVETSPITSPLCCHLTLKLRSPNYFHMLYLSVAY